MQFSGSRLLHIDACQQTGILLFHQLSGIANQPLHNITAMHHFLGHQLQGGRWLVDQVAVQILRLHRIFLCNYLAIRHNPHDDRHHHLVNQAYPDTGHSDIENSMGIGNLPGDDLHLRPGWRNALNKCRIGIYKPDKQQTAGNIEHAVSHRRPLGIF